VTEKIECEGPSCREVKIDVWKYLQTAVMGLYAIYEENLHNQDRALRWGSPIISVIPREDFWRILSSSFGTDFYFKQCLAVSVQRGAGRFDAVSHGALALPVLQSCS